jgi:hypothetical protein
MSKINSKETKLYTLRFTNKLVSEEAILLIGELTRLHAKQRIKLDPKSYEQLPRDGNDSLPDDSIINEWSAEEWHNYWEDIEYIQSKKHDIFLENGGFTNQEAHMYAERENLLRDNK